MDVEQREATVEPTTRDRLLVAARELFLTKGYNGASIRDIAGAIDTSLSNIYHYYGNKEGILIEIITLAREQLTTALRAIVQSDLPAREKFERLITEHLKIIVGSPSVEALRIYEDSTESAGRIGREAQREVLAIYKQAIAALVEEGLVQTRYPSVLAFNILGGLNWVRTWYRPDGPLSLDEIADELLRFVEHGAFAGRSRHG